MLGIPAAVIEMAREKLQLLEQDSVTRPLKPQIQTPLQSELFSADQHPVLQRLADLDPDGLSAREALQLIYELKQKI